MEEKIKNRRGSTRPENRRGIPKSQIRSERRKRSNRKKSLRNRLIVFSISIFAILVIASLVVPGLLGTRSGADAREPLPFNAGGPTPALEDLGYRKILVGTSHPPYSTNPATSGPHWSIRPKTHDLAPDGAPVKWGKYKQEIPDEALLHNLTHGGIGVHYNCETTCEQLIDQLETLVKKDKVQIVMSPYSLIKSKIAITSWRHILHLEEFDEIKINEFIKAYRDRAPESFLGNYWGDAIQ